MKKILDFLINLGLSTAEAKIYTRLTELGQSSMTELAHSLQMNRVTTHFNVQNLIDKGLITHVKQGRSRELTAQSPDSLQYLIEQKDNHVKRLKEEFINTIPLMKKTMPLINKPERHFDVKFFQGKNGVKAIYREVLKSTELRSYVNISNIFEVFPENPQLFPEAVSRKHLKMWEIIEDSLISRNYVKTVDPKRYSYKFFPSDWNISVFDYMIFDGKIAMITGKQEPKGILIVNDDMYKNAKALFEMLWRLLPTIK